MLLCECIVKRAYSVLLLFYSLLSWQQPHMKKAIKEHADKLIREHGNDAYRIALEAARAARRQRRSRLELFLEKVAREISHRAPERLGLRGLGTQPAPPSF
jgi:hypothetical protein